MALTFKDLSIGDKFIIEPIPTLAGTGSPYPLLIKTETGGAVSVVNGAFVVAPDDENVIAIKV